MNKSNHSNSTSLRIDRVEYSFPPRPLSRSLGVAWSLQNFCLSYCRRPYRVECTGSLLTSEVKRRRARLVLGWGTAREDLRVLSAFGFRRLLSSTCDICRSVEFQEVKLQLFDKDRPSRRRNCSSDSQWDWHAHGFQQALHDANRQPARTTCGNT